jgi:RNA polymerase sigma factor (sigma-70 family)
MNTDEPLPTRASLLGRLKNAGDDASWEEFHRAYHGLLVGVARRAGLNENEAEEAVQDTLIAVARRMPEFRYEAGKDSFKGWLLQIVRWKIIDQCRKRRAEPEKKFIAEDHSSEGKSDAVSVNVGGVARTAILAEISDPALNLDVIWDAEWQRHLLARALARVKRQVKPEQYAIYHLHVIEERSIAEVRRTLDVNVAQVYLAKRRVGAALKKELQRLQKTEI